MDIIYKRLRLPELETQVEDNIHHCLELKHFQFLSVSTYLKLHIPSFCLSELVFRIFVSLYSGKSLWLAMDI